MKKRVLINVSYLDGNKVQKRTFYKHGSEEWIVGQFENLVEFYLDLSKQHNLKDLIITTEEITTTVDYKLFY